VSLNCLCDRDVGAGLSPTSASPTRDGVDIPGSQSRDLQSLVAWDREKKKMFRLPWRAQLGRGEGSAAAALRCWCHASCLHWLCLTAVRRALLPSGPVDQWWKMPPRRSRGQTRATRGAKNPPQRATGVSRDLACVLNTRGCPQVFCTAPRSSILCGCINVPGRQVNAVWGRYPTACTMYVKKGLECVGGSSAKSLPPSS
jgi:hypothetical protein